MRYLSLGDEGTSYVRSYLEGEIGLCAMLRLCPLERGSCVGIVPDEVWSLAGRDLSAGGIVEVGSARAQNAVLRAYLGGEASGTRAHTDIAQDPWARVEDARPRGPNDELALEAGLGICHVSSVPMLDDEEVGFLISDNVGFKYVWCFLPESFELTGSNLSDEELLPPSVTHILVPAFDNETFIIWEAERDPTSNAPR